MKLILKLIVIFTGHAILLAIFGPIALSVASGIILANMLMGMEQADTETTETKPSALTSAYTAPKKDKLIEIKPNQFKIG